MHRVIYISCKAQNMEKDCGYYFLTSTAREIWRTNDARGYERMWQCLVKEKKAIFLKLVVHPSSKILPERLQQFGEDAFLNTWGDFILRGKEGKENIRNEDYTLFFLECYRRVFIKLVKKELKRIDKIENPEIPPEIFKKPEVDEKMEKEFSEKLQHILNRLTGRCREIMLAKYLEGFSHDEIAAKYGLADRKASIYRLSECQKKFITYWRENNN